MFLQWQLRSRIERRASKCRLFSPNVLITSAQCGLAETWCCEMASAHFGAGGPGILSKFCNATNIRSNSICCIYWRPPVAITMVPRSRSSNYCGYGRKRFLRKIESPDLGGFDLCMPWLGPALLGIFCRRLSVRRQLNSALHLHPPVVLPSLPLTIGTPVYT